MTPTPAEKNVLTVLESCFKVVPGMEAELVEPRDGSGRVATSQPGFISVEVGTIVNSNWLYFGVQLREQEPDGRMASSPASPGDTEDGLREVLVRPVPAQVAGRAAGRGAWRAPDVRDAPGHEIAR